MQLLHSFSFPKTSKTSQNICWLKRHWICLDLLWKNDLCDFLSSMIAFASINLFSFNLAYTFYGNIPCGRLLPNLSATSFIVSLYFNEILSTSKQSWFVVWVFFIYLVFAFFWSSLLLKHLIHVIQVFHSKIQWYHIRQVHWLSWIFNQ